MRRFYPVIWLAFIPSSLAIFGSFSSGSCPCPCQTIQPACPVAPPCAIPAPCPVPAPAIPIPVAIPAAPMLPSYQPTYYNYPAFQALPAVQPSYTVAATDGCTSCGATMIGPQYRIQTPTYQQAIPPLVLPMVESRVVVPATVPAPTLIPSVEQVSAYDDTAPALPPPAPLAPSYRTSDVVQPYAQGSKDAAVVDEVEEESLHSGETALIGRRLTTEGVLEPLEKFDRRNKILKRMRNARTLAAVIPRTNLTCNSNILANVMARAIADDVSVSKRMVMRATELAFDGAKFDVFCATGEFSYSIHSRKYCEVTRDEITCFAFR